MVCYWLWRRIHCGLWTAPAERSGDGALAEAQCLQMKRNAQIPATIICVASSQSGVALRLPPHSKWPRLQPRFHLSHFAVTFFR